ncbi:type II-A CRISPR-associated protein Csn2 [Collinsella sp. zg1085]|uniref:type II-A CRISPR-associated protein Csn2 n=1 Tax=Collinsella sp. zg1085 TaxID=2844380 RepID=UPI001C0AD0C0|nr:type II-A CRISPR-associated protein Csn2 [Collinsella sp. zg1085]QWT17272.1 type II-A CRISPR-associated protein Csn2 [Collinsella sp. zg1085]
MRLVFSCIETPIDLVAGVPRVLEVENRKLFCRACRSLNRGDMGETDYVGVWDGERELSRKTTLCVVSDPLHLPWKDSRLDGQIFSTFEGLVFEDEETRQSIEQSIKDIQQQIAIRSFQLTGSYHFALEWDVIKFLKTYSYSVDQMTENSYLDSLISFLDFAHDMRFNGVLVFIGLKNFLSADELKSVYERIFFHQFYVLLLEREHDERKFAPEVKTHVNLQLLEE